MSWSVEWSDAALKQLRKMDPQRRNAVLAWMTKNVDGCDDPRARGKALVGNLSNRWRYRVGDNRVICDISDERLVVLALEVLHRSKAYTARSAKRLKG